MDKLKKDLFAVKEENCTVEQENTKLKTLKIKLEHDLEALKEQEKILIDQLSHNDQIMQQLQDDLRNEMNKQQECQKVIGCLKQNISDLANEKENNEKSLRELANKVNQIFLIFEKNKIFNYFFIDVVKIKEKDSKFLSVQHEVDSLQNKLRETREELSQKDSQLKLAINNMGNNEKQRHYLQDEVRSFKI